MEKEKVEDDKEDLYYSKRGQGRKWDASAAGIEKWHSLIQAASQNVTNRMIELAGIKPGDTVLDIATGTGDPAIDTAKIVQPRGHVLAVDLSRQRLAIARRRAKEQGLDDVIEFIESDIEAINFPYSKFDAILSRWGLMFFPNLEVLLAKIRNALLPGKGVFVAAIWSKPEKVPSMKIPLSILDRLGVPPLPLYADPFRLSDVSSLVNLFIEARFEDVKTEAVPVVYQFDSAEEYLDFAYETSSSLRSRITAAYPEDYRQDEIRKMILEEARLYVDSKNRLSLTNETVLIAGLRPLH